MIVNREELGVNKKIVAVITAAGIVCGTSLPTVASPLNNKLNQSKVQLQQNKNALKKAQKNREDLEVEVQDLDSKIESLMREANKIEGNIKSTEKNIEVTKKQLEKSKKELQAQQAIYNKRVRAMYISGSDSYLEVILQSKSFSDLISRVDMIKSIVVNDKKVISKLNSIKEEVNKKKVALDTEKQKLVALKTENTNKLAKMDEKKREQQTLLATLIREEDKYKSKVSDSQRLVASAEAEIQRALAIASSVSRPSSRPSRGGGYVGGVSNSGSSKKPSSNTVSVSGSIGKGSGSSAAAVAARIAMGYQGVNYVWGGTTPSGFDCSGLVQYSFRQAGISLPRTSQQQMRVGIPVSRSELQVGDLVFPHSGHVGIYVGNGCMVHAPHTGAKVKVAPIYRFTTARRIR